MRDTEFKDWKSSGADSESGFKVWSWTLSNNTFSVSTGEYLLMEEFRI